MVFVMKKLIALLAFFSLVISNVSPMAVSWKQGVKSRIEVAKKIKMLAGKASNSNKSFYNKAQKDVLAAGSQGAVLRVLRRKTPSNSLLGNEVF